MASLTIMRASLLARGPVLPLVFGAAAGGRPQYAGPTLRLTSH